MIRNKTKFKTTLIIFVTALFFISQAYSQPADPRSGKDITVQQWVNDNFAKGKVPPFSFNYGGIDSKTFITGWKYSAEKVVSEDPAMKKSVYSYTDGKSGLVVKCFVTSYTDFPAVEWVIKFINSSGSNTPLIDMAEAINYSFNYKGEGQFILHHSLGSDAKRSDFQQLDELLQPGKKISMMPSGGRSSDNSALPFFNIEAPGSRGTVFAIGWTGKWYAEIEQAGQKSVTVRSGLARMRLVLYPGEEIRTPSICMLFWKGEDRMVGHNRFRQFILAHHFRKINGKFAEYPLSGSFDYGDPVPCNEYNCLTADYAIALVKRYQQFRVMPEVFWLDAGWYTGCGWDKGDWWQNVGNWTVEKDRFPDGLRPVADAVHAVGAKFMVWFEPERVRKGTQFDKLNTEWLLRLPGDDNALFNLGNPEARIFLTDYISDFIRKEGIDYYRQDFNFDPMPFWEKNDKPDRTGISEIRHIEGLYAYWDSLLVRFPQLLIDNCASGGRRLDIETTTRSAPLWRTDYQYGEPNGYQCHTYGLNFYLPIHGTAIYKSENYTFRSGLGATAVMNWEVTGRNSESIPVMQKSLAEYKILRPYFYGDYYPLTGTGNLTGDDIWLAYQLNRSPEGDGIIVAFRRKESSADSIDVRLRGVESGSNYLLFNEDTKENTELSGEILKNGYTLKLTEKPGSVLIRYKRVP
ncbi:MAG: alpha-galactosidase [Bacteroidales bacterium]|nr:alpha-galactosidase [Bacteroidales bacterium]